MICLLQQQALTHQASLAIFREITSNNLAHERRLARAARCMHNLS